jgi:L-threonylcarbamoyladenylate synthase
MLDRHYAPKARLVLFSDLSEAMPAAAEARAKRGKIAALVRTVRVNGVDAQECLPDDPAGYGRELYGALHRLDQQGVVVILVERPPSKADWAGIRDRLERAARG